MSILLSAILSWSVPAVHPPDNNATQHDPDETSSIRESRAQKVGGNHIATRHGGPDWEDTANNDATNVPISPGARVLIQLPPGPDGLIGHAPAPH
jgi:hypothetical protein